MADPMSETGQPHMQIAGGTTSHGAGKTQRIDETAYLMSSPTNAQRLRRAIADVEAGNIVERDAIK